MAGAIIGAIDLLIASYARALGATLVTNHPGYFSRVPGFIAKIDRFKRSCFDPQLMGDACIEPAGKHLRDMAGIGFLVACCLIVGLPRYPSGLDLGDEGFLASGAVQVAHGQIPNRDFVSLQPPLAFYTAAAVFKLVGTSLLSLRYFGLGLYMLIPILLYGISRQINGRLVSLAAAFPAVVLGIPFFYFVPFPAWQGITASLAAALLFLRATAHARFGRALAAGMFTGASLWLRQDQAFYLVISLVIFTLALGHARDSGRQEPAEGKLSGQLGHEELSAKAVFNGWLVGLALVVLPLGFYWLWRGALPDMFRQLVLFPLTTYARTSSLPFPSLRSGLTLGRNVVFLMYYLQPAWVLVVLAWVGWRLFRRSFHAPEARLCFLAIWSGLCFCQVLVRCDRYHWLYTLPPFFLLAATSLGMICAHLSVAGRKTAPAIVSLATISAAGFLWLVKPVFLAPPENAKETISLPRAEVRAPGAANLKKFVLAIQKLAPPDRPILCLPYQPMFYFLCDRRNPTRWHYLWPGDQTPEEHQQLIREAKDDPPAVVVVTGEKEVAGFAQDILDYVHQDYELAADVGGLFRIYTRIAARK